MLTTEDYAGEVLEAFNKESDRGAALLAVSFLEGYLEKYLRHCMNPSTDLDQLFKGYGPLSSFSSKIDVAHAFNVITDTASNDLHVLRKVRNHFAHHPLDASLRDQKIKDLLGNLRHPKLIEEITNPTARLILPVSLFVADVDFLMSKEPTPEGYEIVYGVRITS